MKWILGLLLVSSALAQTPTPTPAQVVFNWSAVPVGDHASNYKLYEQVGAAYNLIATIAPNVLTYSMAAPTDGHSHIYVVAAVNSTKEGPKSNQALWPPDPHPPQNLSTR